MNIAIIPARFGSKRIPHKNIREFMGKPMLAYAIECAKQANIFDIVMVSTESEEVAKVAKQFGAEVPFYRSEKNASDFATTFDVIEEVLLMYQQQNIFFDTMCCIYPCVPFLTPEILCDSYKYLEKYSSVMPVTKYSVPIEWAMKIDNNVLIPFDEKAQLIRSQDLEPKYYDVGMFYWCNVDILFDKKTIAPAPCYAYVLPESQVQDIDTLEDWDIAEMKYRAVKDN